MSSTASTSMLNHTSKHIPAGHFHSASEYPVHVVVAANMDSAGQIRVVHAPAEISSDVFMVGAPEAKSLSRMESRPSALRKRFYPAQWKKLQAAGLEALAASRGLRLEWIGWDRSLPRLYLPLEGLSRLMTEALDAVASEVARGPHMVREGVRPISLRISSQRSGLAGNLILVIEHDQWNCRLAGQAALNSPSLLTSVEMRMDRVRRQVMSLGGTVSFNAVAGGGACMRISLPIDEPRGLVKAWLDQQLASQANGAAHDTSIHLFIVGRRRESAQQLLAADERLQLLIDANEFIYRTTADRWLWLRTSRELPPFARTGAWLTEHVSAWRMRLAASTALDSSMLVRWQLAGSIAGAMQRLIGSKVAPLDCITSGMPSSLPKPSGNTINPPHARPAAKARWRYPI